MEEDRRGIINHSIINLWLLITIARQLGQARVGWGQKLGKIVGRVVQEACEEER